MFGFLADVRNYSHSPVIAEPKHALPEDASPETKEAFGDGADWHTATWLTLEQMNAVDYEQVFWDRRVMKNGNGAALAEEGEGEHLTLREFLGSRFFKHLEVLKSLGKTEDVRIVFWFDN